MVDYKRYAKHSDEEITFWRSCARRNYRPGSTVHPTWNPIFIEECLLMNTEVGVFRRPFIRSLPCLKL